MASVLYNAGRTALVNGGVDWDTHTIKVALVTSSYTPDVDTHENYDDLTNEVANGNGYTTGGATLGSASIAADNTANRAKLDGADVSWTSATITARAAVIYRDTGTPSTSTLIAYVDFGEDKTSSGGTFLITWSSDGTIQV